jgi:acetyltransferase-like isoleucine patch superfamily enzyme
MLKMPEALVGRIVMRAALSVAPPMQRMTVYKRFIDFGAVRGQVRITGRVSFGSEPYLLSFGDRITLADGVRFITHDGATILFRDSYPDLNLHLPIHVLDNVFIGAGAIVLPGVVIGPDAVVGAGAVVTRDVAPRSVVAGNPARLVKTLDEYERSSCAKAADSLHTTLPPSW